MGKNKITVDTVNTPGRRPLLAVILLALTAVFLPFWWIVFDLSFDCWYSDCTALVFVGVCFHSMLLAAVFCIWERCRKVVYRHDFTRRALKVYSIIGYLMISSAMLLDEDWFLGALIILVVDLVVFAPLHILQLGLCDCFCDSRELSGKGFLSGGYTYSGYDYYSGSDSGGSSCSGNGGRYSSRGSSDYRDDVAPEPWLKPMTADYYGKHGEFYTNDRIRANMEDMEQMSHDGGFDPHDHGYDWDEISDAQNDGYL